MNASSVNEMVPPGRKGRLLAPHLRWKTKSDPGPEESLTEGSRSYSALAIVFFLHVGLIAFLLFYPREEALVSVAMQSTNGPLRVKLVSNTPPVPKSESPKPVAPPEPPKQATQPVAKPKKEKVATTKAESTRAVETAQDVAPAKPAERAPSPPGEAVATAAPSAAPTSTPAASPAPVAAAPSDGPKEVSKVDCRTPEPEYPRGARMRGQTGTVLVRLVIDEQGGVSATINRSSGVPELDRSALQAAMSAECNPYRENGRSIRAAAVQTFKFALSQ